MKRILFALLLTLAISAVVPLLSIAEEDDNYIGAGLMMRDKPYTDVETSSMPVPIVYFHKDKWFVEGVKAGFEFWKYEDLKLRGFIAPRLMGYEEEDSLTLHGMDDREMSLDAGFELKWLLQNMCDIELIASMAFDTLSVYEGQEAKIAAQKEIKGEIFVLKPSIGLKWQSEDLVNYYYGVKASEAVAGRPEYLPDQDYNYFANVDFYIGISKDLVLITSFGYEYLGNEIDDSPIVDDRSIMSGVVGIVKRF